MKKTVLLTLSLSLFTMFTGCEERSTSSVAEVHWDRDMCARCVMVVSDRKNSVQVRDPQGKTYMFDDIGCMVLWFKNNKIAWKDSATIWVNDVETEKWIDARKAIYTGGNTTPMAFGFSAHATKNNLKKEEQTFSFEEISKEILKRKE